MIAIPELREFCIKLQWRLLPRLSFVFHPFRRKSGKDGALSSSSGVTLRTVRTSSSPAAEWRGREMPSKASGEAQVVLDIGAAVGQRCPHVVGFQHA